MQALDQAYLLDRLKYMAAARAHDLVFKASHRLPEAPWVLQAATRDFARLPLTAQLYFHAFQSMDEQEGAAHYWQLKSKTLEAENDLPAEDVWDLFVYLINFCARALRRGPLEPRGGVGRPDPEPLPGRGAAGVRP